MIIGIHGAYARNGTTGAQAAFGVYFGESNPRNNASTLVYPEDQLSTGLAEIEACSNALSQALDVAEAPPFGRLHRIIIKSSLDCFVNAITDGIYTWRESGFRIPNGSVVEDWPQLKWIDSRAQRLEQKGILVQFWLVPSDLNKNAVRGAQWALERQSEKRQSEVVKN